MARRGFSEQARLRVGGKGVEQKWARGACALRVPDEQLRVPSAEPPEVHGRRCVKGRRLSMAGSRAWAANAAATLRRPTKGARPARGRPWAAVDGLCKQCDVGTLCLPRLRQRGRMPCAGLRARWLIGCRRARTRDGFESTRAWVGTGVRCVVHVMRKSHHGGLCASNGVLGASQRNCAEVPDGPDRELRALCKGNGRAYNQTKSSNQARSQATCEDRASRHLRRRGVVASNG